MISKIIKNNKWFLISLFIFSFLLRATVFYYYLGKDNNYWQVDSGAYHKIAISLSQDKGVSIDGNPNFYRLPGYSYFLSFYYKYFEQNRKNALWLQIFLASFIPLLIFLLSFVLVFGNLWAARLASLYSSFHLGFVLYSGFFMTESLFVFLFLIFSILFFENLHLFFCRRNLLNGNNVSPFIYCFDEICSGAGFIALEEKLEEEKIRRNFIKLFFAGLFLGVSGLVRPVGHYFLIFSILILFFSRNSFKNKFKKSLVLFIGWLTAVLPWLLRNYLLLGQIFFHTLPGGHFLHFSAARNVMYEINCNFDQAKDYLRGEVIDLSAQEAQKIGRNLNEIELCNLRQDLAIKYFEKYPLLTLKHWLTDILRTSLSLYSAEVLYLESGRKQVDYFSEKRTIWSLFKRYLIPQTDNIYLKLLVYLEILFFLFILFGVLAGFILSMILLFRYGLRSPTCLFCKTLPFVFIFLVIGLAGGYSRMRLPAEPFLIILSFSFYVWIFKLKELKKENGLI
ncbi:MAG: hypothetical protein ABIF12_00640 [bacterium]